jgi:ribosome-interacting GTPase 1
MLATISKHKGTAKMQADLKHRLSQLRKAEARSAHGKGPDPFHIPKSGAGQVVLIGPPNTGKSSLLAATTHANAKIAEFPFTTVVPQPGMWTQDDVQIELVDTPPLTAEQVRAHTKQGLKDLFRWLWQLLGMVRVYSKEPGRAAQMEKPFILPAGSTIADLARLIHRDLSETMKFARLGGHSRFAGQQVYKTEILLDRDVVEIHE